jgi:hypothetical protein
MRKLLPLWGFIAIQALAQTPFPEGAVAIKTTESHGKLLGKMFATKNADKNGVPVGDTIEFKADEKIIFTEGKYKENFVFDESAYRDTLVWQGNDGNYCSPQYKWCMDIRTQDDKILTRWGSGDGKNKPILVWAPYIK